MPHQPKGRIPSILKKFLMALTGLILTGFVLVHMLGNLNMFLGSDAMNTYAHFLQTLPRSVLWGFRAILILTVGIHVWMAILITQENRRARPIGYSKTESLATTLSSRTMGFTGSFLLFFIVFHIAHFTMRIVFPEYQSMAFHTLLNGEPVYNVYKMVITGFSKTWVSAFYILAMAFLCMHLSHGVSSMFQSLGLRNNKWIKFFNGFARLYGWVIFLGFSSISACVLLTKYFGFTIFA